MVLGPLQASELRPQGPAAPVLAGRTLDTVDGFRYPTSRVL